MKITIELPERAVCAFLNYIYRTDTGMSMGVKQIGTDDIKRGKVLVCDACDEAEKGGNSDA